MYRLDLDSLKGMSIIAVVLFHLGLLKSGYLGVDSFFVINGFFVVPTVINKIQQSEFSFFVFLEKKIIRLLPLIVLASIVSLVLGYYSMLPDHYENLAQSVVASNLMSENILSAITTKNYWDVVNEYKPLMHLWYVGILFEFYIILPILMKFSFWLGNLLKQNGRNWMIVTLVLTTLFSFILYLLPFASPSDKFYFLPYRFFELGIGGLVALFSHKVTFKDSSVLIHKIITVAVVLVLFCSVFNVFTGTIASEGVVVGRGLSLSNGVPLSPECALLLVVLFTSIVASCETAGSFMLKSQFLAWIGKMSYSIFIWHQVLLAFYRYRISYNMDISTISLFLIVVFVVSAISYFLIEKKIKVSLCSFVSWIFASLLVSSFSFYLFLHAGVVRDIPELDVVKGTEHRGMFGEYCDRIYNYKDFPRNDNGKPNVLVVGVSFGRDFANVLLESQYKDIINLAYLHTWSNKNAKDLAKRSDYIFTFTEKKKVPDFVWEGKKSSCKVMGISTKNYGSCNGIIFKNRDSDDYFLQTASIEPGYKELNTKWKSQWGENYIDLLTPSLVDEQHVRVFTDDNKYISQDCRHLTKAGAQWYAKRLDWKSIFNK